MNKVVIELDASQIKLYLECPRAWQLRYMEDLRKVWIVPKFKKDYAGQGTYVHALLCHYYNMKALLPGRDVFTHSAAALTLFQQLKLRKKLELPEDFEKLVNMRFTQYVIQHSQSDYVPLIKNGVPSTEVKFSVKLYEDTTHIFILTGRIDLLCAIETVNGTSLKGFIDHKTQERDSTLYAWKPQFLSYALATGFNYGGFNYFGLQKDFKDKVTLHRDWNYIPDWKIKEWKQYIIERVYISVAREAMSLKENVQNLSSCGGPDEKRPCEFAEICNAPNDEIRSLIKWQNFEKVPHWSPWND